MRFAGRAFMYADAMFIVLAGGGQRPRLIWITSSNGGLIPPVRKTWAPRGQTPIVRHHQKRDRISVISALSISPRRFRCGLYYMLHAKNIQHPEVCQFLRHLLRHLRGPVIVIWDNASIHKGEPIREIWPLPSSPSGTASLLCSGTESA